MQGKNKICSQALHRTTDTWRNINTTAINWSKGILFILMLKDTKLWTMAFLPIKNSESSKGMKHRMRNPSKVFLSLLINLQTCRISLWAFINQHSKKSLSIIWELYHSNPIKDCIRFRLKHWLLTNRTPRPSPNLYAQGRR